MSYFARTKEFIVSTQPGDRYSEAIPIKGATRVIATRQNTTNSFCSSSSIQIRVFGSFDGSTFRQIINNSGFNTSTGRAIYHGTFQNDNLADLDLTLQISGLSYLKLYNITSTNTATATYKVMVIT